HTQGSERSVDDQARRADEHRERPRGRLRQKDSKKTAKARNRKRTIMKLAHILVVCLAVGAAPAALAQRWELGGGASGAFNTSQAATLPTGTATVKIAPGFGLGVWATNNTSAHWGGEIRYLYQNGELRVEQGSTKAAMSGDSHSLFYDFHWHTTEAGSRV